MKNYIYIYYIIQNSNSLEYFSLEYLVSNIDILNKLKKFSVKKVLYKDLQHISNTTQLLPIKYCAVCILIKTTANSGHWTC